MSILHSLSNTELVMLILETNVVDMRQREQRKKSEIGFKGQQAASDTKTLEFDEDKLRLMGIIEVVKDKSIEVATNITSVLLGLLLKPSIVY